MASNAPLSPEEPPAADDRKLDVAAQLSPPRSPSPSPIPLPSKQERERYHFGLPSLPSLVARTSTAVCEPFGPGVFRKMRELGPVGRDDLGGAKKVQVMNPEIIKTLDAHGVEWNSINYFRLGDAEEYDKRPIVLLISVWPGALTNEDGSSLPVAGKVAVACKKVLEKYDIFDVDCEIREAEMWPDYRGNRAK